MAFDKTATLKGAPKQYRLNPNVKRYTLRDHGFQETKTGNFQFIRSLSTIGNKQSTMFKVVVDKDLATLKMSTTTANGLKTIDVYGNKNMEENVKNLEYMLAHFVENNILEEI